MTARHRTSDDAAKAVLFPSQEEREALELRTAALLIRNAMLRAIENERARAGTSKRSLAEVAQVDYAALRRLMTTEGANPTLDTVARLLAATHMRIQLVSERGDVIEIPDEQDALTPV